jgi:hypothetical protein
VTEWRKVRDKGEAAVEKIIHASLDDGGAANRSL